MIDEKKKKKEPLTEVIEDLDDSLDEEIALDEIEDYEDSFFAPSADEVEMEVDMAKILNTIDDE